MHYLEYPLTKILLLKSLLVLLLCNAILCIADEDYVDDERFIQGSALLSCDIYLCMLGVRIEHNFTVHYPTVTGVFIPPNLRQPWPWEIKRSLNSDEPRSVSAFKFYPRQPPVDLLKQNLAVENPTSVGLTQQVPARGMLGLFKPAAAVAGKASWDDCNTARLLLLLE